MQKKHILFFLVFAVFMFFVASENANAISLKGKNVLVEGDSIQTGQYGAFGKKMCKSMGAKSVTNKAVKSATLAYKKDGNCGKNSVWYRIKNMSPSAIKKYNAYVISAGTNDWYYWSGVNLGSYKKNKGSTTCGAVNCICDRIWKYNPKAEIIFISPIYRYQNGSKVQNCDNVKNDYGYTLQDYRCAIYNAAAWHGARVICGDYISKKKECKKKAYLQDYLHPTKKYAKTLALRAKKELASLR